jgi:hypothetical protein
VLSIPNDADIYYLTLPDAQQPSPAGGAGGAPIFGLSLNRSVRDASLKLVFAFFAASGRRVGYVLYRGILSSSRFGTKVKN